MRAFSTFHPWVLFIYFFILIGMTMLTTQPIHVAIAFLLSQVLYAFGVERKVFLKHLLWMILIFLIIGLSNPLFVHQGVSILFYMNGNPITLEAIYYGFGFAGMITSVLTLFLVFQRVMSSDKLIYLFAKSVPTISLIISMTLRLIPKFKRQTKDILQTQRLLGMDYHRGHVIARIRHIATIFSMLLTWAFENSIDTADSMKARGYGLRFRTNFSIFKWERRDIAAIVSFLLIAIYLWTSYTRYLSHFYYYPHITQIGYSMSELLGYGCYIVLLLVPIGIEWRSYVKWKYA